MPTGGVTPSGGGGPAAGSYLPVANKTGVTVDTTTYSDSIRGGGAKMTTLVFPTEQAAFGFAISGDAFPRVVFGCDMESSAGLYFSDGTINPVSAGGNQIYESGGNLALSPQSSTVQIQGTTQVSAAAFPAQAPRINQVSPLFTITDSALPTVTITSGIGRRVSTARDVETVTPFTGDGTNNAATCAIALSPDDVTYSTLATISIAAALNLTGVLTDNVNVRVPAGWYVKLTAVHGTLGTTTYY